MLEKNIQSKILTYLKKNGIFCYKHIATNINGIPDIVFIYKGQPVWLEVKKPGGVVSSLQKFQINRINEAGAKAFVVHSFDEFLKILESFK